MNKVEIYNISQLKEALKQNPKAILEVKDPYIASAIKLLYSRKNAGINPFSLISSLCIPPPFPLNRLLLTILVLAIILLIDKYCINEDKKVTDCYDAFDDSTTSKHLTSPSDSHLYSYKPLILKPKPKQDDN